MRQHIPESSDLQGDLHYFAFLNEATTMEQRKALKSPEPDQLVSIAGSQVVNYILYGIGALGLAVDSQNLILQEHNMKSPHSLVLMVNLNLIFDLFVRKIHHSVVNAPRKILGILA